MDFSRLKAVFERFGGIASFNERYKWPRGLLEFCQKKSKALIDFISRPSIVAKTTSLSKKRPEFFLGPNGGYEKSKVLKELHSEQILQIFWISGIVDFLKTPFAQSAFSRQVHLPSLPLNSVSVSSVALEARARGDIQIIANASQRYFPPSHN